MPDHTYEARDHDVLGPEILSHETETQTNRQVRMHAQQINQGMQRNRVEMTRINIHISVERNSSSRRLVEVSNSIIIEKQRQ